MRHTHFWLLLATFATCSVQAEQTPPTREILLTKPITLTNPDITAKVVRVAFPPGYKTPIHTHEGPGPRYVLTGEITVEDHGKTATYKAGEVFWETGEAMTAANCGKQEATMLIFEMAPAKAP